MGHIILIDISMKIEIWIIINIYHTVKKALNHECKENMLIYLGIWYYKQIKILFVYPSKFPSLLWIDHSNIEYLSRRDNPVVEVVGNLPRYLSNELRLTLVHAL